MATCTCSTPEGPISLMERPSLLPEMTSEHLCAQCASLDLNALLQPRDPKENNDGPCLRSTMGSACPLCRFLATIASAGHPFSSPGLDTEIEYFLITRPFHNSLLDFSLDDARNNPIFNFNVLEVCPVHADDPTGRILPVDYRHNLQHPKLPAIREIDAASIDFAILRNWLIHCQNHHSASCTSLDESLLQEITGLKLIDCQTRRVVEAPGDATYVALSYVWGKSHAAEATVLSRSSLPETVPRTIEDAIQVVLRLGLKYLWIDKYCINQSNATELAQQISIMDMIYNAAFCTIVAACGEDASFGLPGVGLTRRPEQPVIHLNGQVWVSSLRAPDLVYFECNIFAYLETVSYDLHCQTETSYLGPGRMFHGSLGYAGGGALHRHIAAYSKRSLSFQSDIINALSGVFRLFSRQSTPTYHYWGVPIYYNEAYDEKWYSSLPTKSLVIGPVPFHQFGREIDAAFARGLCWQLYIPCPRRRNFPSWSWSGWVGPLADSNWASERGLGDSQVKIRLQRTNGEYERLSESVIRTICQRGPPYTGYTPVLCIEAWVIDTTLTYLAHGFNGLLINRNEWVRHPRYFVSVEALGPGESIHGILRWPVVLSTQVQEGDEMHEGLCRETFTCVLLSKASKFALIVRRRAGEVVERIGHVRISPVIVDPGNLSDSYHLHDHADLFDMFPRTRRTVLLG